MRHGSPPWRRRWRRPIPLPTPAPLPKEREGRVCATRIGAADRRPAGRAAGRGSAAVRPRGSINCSDGKSDLPASDVAAFNATQRALVAKVSTYLTSVQVLTGNFVQVGPDGRRTTGELYIQKPGKVRFEYDPPSPIDIIADGQSVVVRDRQLATQDLYPLSQTPLRFLLSRPDRSVARHQCGRGRAPTTPTSPW